MKTSKMFVMQALLLGAMMMPMLTTPVLAQQEVDPTWYEPAPTKPVMKTAQAKPQPKPAHKVNATLAEKPKAKKQVRADLPKADSQQLIAARK